jgi:hypothetical protein
MTTLGNLVLKTVKDSGSKVYSLDNFVVTNSQFEIISINEKEFVIIYTPSYEFYLTIF